MSNNRLTVPEKQKFAALERTIQRGLKQYMEVGAALLAIRDEGLYRQQYKTFEEYCAERWSIKRQRAYQLMDASVAGSNLSKIFDTPERESHVEPLTGLEPEAQRIVWEVVQQTAPAGKVTADHVKQVVIVFNEVATSGTTVEALAATVSQKPNYKRDKKSNHAADETVSKPFDYCQTPPVALDPLVMYLNPAWTIWECAAGEGLLVEGLHDSGFEEVIATDILTGQNFFEHDPWHWDCIVTNPPFSLKFRWLERCYALGKPFALLLPVETLGTATAQEMFRDCGVEVIFMDKRINFKMPNKGWDGAGAQFPVAWFTYGLNIGREMTFARMSREAD